jgi:hypothetical protein
MRSLCNQRSTRTVHMAMKTLAAALLCALLAACAPAPSPSFSPPPTAAPSPAPAPSVSASSPGPSVSLPTSTPTETVICVPETGPLPSALGDPCPSAIAAVRTVVEPLGEPIARIYLQPGPFCGGLWPGVGSPPICFGVLVLPGSTMHGWVRFSGTDKVAAVTLHRDVFPVSEAIPSPVPPWTASLAAFTVPPAGWSMP